MRLYSCPEEIGTPDGRGTILDRPEMMFYLYLPIKLADQSDSIPHVMKAVPRRLRPFNKLITQCLSHDWGYDWADSYMYLTVKTLFVTPDYIGGRPGWHTDGFGTEDINFIWASNTPTEFCVQQFDVSEDEQQSIVDMTEQAKPSNIVTYGSQVLRLTAKDVHRCPVVEKPCIRTFFRLSISKDRYNMAGNSHNHLLDYKWRMQEREPERNKTGK